jgi:hypothetical protein
MAETKKGAPASFGDSADMIRFWAKSEGVLYADSLLQQALVSLGHSRSTTWTLLKAIHKASGRFVTTLALGSRNIRRTK